MQGQSAGAGPEYVITGIGFSQSPSFTCTKNVPGNSLISINVPVVHDVLVSVQV